MTKKLYGLFMVFAKIGLFTFGGGYALIAIIEEECVEKRKWLTQEEMSTIVAVAESTPGPMAINCATYVGYRQGGLKGAVFSTLGITLPSFIIIYLISLYFDNFLEITLIANAFKGIKIAVGILIVNAGLNMMKKMEKQRYMKMILVLSCLVMLAITAFSWNFSSIYLLLLAGLVNLIIMGIHSIKIGKGGQR